MNQGNSGRFADDDGVFQDGALLLHFPATDAWVAIFLAFQSQAWHTDDTTGHRLPEVPSPGSGEPDYQVRIVGALVNPAGPAPEPETVTLLNATPADLDLAGWSVADRAGNRHRLSGPLGAGETARVTVAPPVQLGNRGGTITLINDRDLKVHGVAYTQDQARREGWTMIF